MEKADFPLFSTGDEVVCAKAYGDQSHTATRMGARLGVTPEPLDSTCQLSSHIAKRNSCHMVRIDDAATELPQSIGNDYCR